MIVIMKTMIVLKMVKKKAILIWLNNLDKL